MPKRVGFNDDSGTSTNNVIPEVLVSGSQAKVQYDTAKEETRKENGNIENGIGETPSVVRLKNDKPGTFLAMNLDPVDVRKSSQHFDTMAAAVEKSYQKIEEDYAYEKEQLDDLASYLTEENTLGVSNNANPASSVFLHPDRTAYFRQSVSGSMSIPVNKMSIKLYGSEKAVVKEQERLAEAGMWIIHPYSNFRFIWDSLTLLMLLVNIILIPVSIAFWSNHQVGWIQFKYFSDVWFLLDIIFNFRTGVVLDGPDSEVILDPAEIRTIYLKTWFSVDLISTFPFDLIYTLIGGVSTVANTGMKAFNLLRLAKILALLRLLRLSRFIRYMKQWEEIFNFQYELALAFARIFNLIMLMLFICHVNGCLQYMVPMFMDFPDETWAKMHRLHETNVTVWERYSWSVFKSTSHMLCIGYGREPPQGLIDVWVTFFSMVTGAMCFAMFIGNATSLIQSMDSSKRAYKEKYMQVKEYMQFRKLPSDLRHRISDYYENRFQGKMFDEDVILGELNHNLREEVINFNCRGLVSQVPFFSEADPNFVTTVLSKLKFEVYLADDVIVKEGSIGDKLFFINHGTVIIRSERHNIEQRLSDGCYFGEIALLEQNMRRIANVLAETYCYLYTLSVDDFNAVLKEFPRQRQKLQHVAASRMDSNGPREKNMPRINTHLGNIQEEPSDIFDVENEDK